MNITITLTGDKELIKKFTKFAEVLGDWTPEIRLMTDFMKDYYSGVVFATEGGVLGSRWAPVAPKYEFYKRTHALRFGILQFSGKMQGNFASQAGRTEGEVTNTTPYFKYHQSKGARKKLPRRPMIGINDAQKNQFSGILKKGLVTKMRTTFK